MNKTELYDKYYRVYDKKNRKKCSKCNLYILKSKYKRHILKCNGKRQYNIYEYFKNDRINFICPICNKIYNSKGIRYHFWTHSKKGREFKPFLNKIPWNKNQNKKTNKKIMNISIKIKEQCKKCKKLNIKRGFAINYIGTNKHKDACSRGGGKGGKLRIKYKHKNGNIITLQSRWEETVAKDLDKNNIKWIRPKAIFWRDNKNIKHRYYPDFYLSEYNIYLDPKNNFKRKIDDLKLKAVILQNNIKLFILNEKQLTWNNIYNLYKNNEYLKVCSE